MPCEKPICNCRKLIEKLGCAYYEPSRNSKYYTCNYYYTYRLPCPKEVPNCDGCEFLDKVGGGGRPNQSGINWGDKEEVSAYKRRIRCQKSQLPPSKP